MKFTLLALAGLQSLLTVQSSYQLSKYSGAALALTYQPAMGLGMQVALLPILSFIVQFCMAEVCSQQLAVKAVCDTAPVLACCMTGLTAFFGLGGCQSVAIGG